MFTYYMVENGKILDNKQKIIYYPPDDFINDIVNKDVCFICGADRRDKEFNDEHIIPNWLLKRLDLFNKKIKLPNNQLFSYSKYKVPCCKECNSELGVFYETPISQILKPKFEDLIKNINEENTKLIFKWMSLIFLKTHIKDKDVRFDPDSRNSSINNSALYDWLYIHHVHCLARSYYTSAVIEDTVYGSLIFIPTLEESPNYKFDYIDNHQGRVVSLRAGDYAIIAVLDDSRFSAIIFQNQLKKLRGHRLSFLQIREVVANFISININIKNRPSYFSGLDDKCRYTIFAKCPVDIELLDKEDWVYTPGKILRDYIENLEGINLNSKELFDIENDKNSFLFDEHSNFISNS